MADVFPKIITANNICDSTACQSDCDSDCACEMNRGNDAVWTNQPTLLDYSSLKRSPSQTVRLNQEHVVVFGSDLRPVVVNQPAVDLLTRMDGPDQVALFERMATLWGTAQLTTVLSDLMSAGLITSHAGRTSNNASHIDQPLVAWLHMSGQCNLACKYCYAERAHSKMSSATGHAAIRAICRSARSNNFHRIKVKYAGGEPLIHFDLVKDLHRYASCLAEQSSLTLEEVLLTNATLLTPSIADRIREWNMSLMISLDGLTNIHNRSRLYADGRSALDRVLSGIDIALDHGIRPTISITITDNNLDGLGELVRWLLEKDLHFVFNFYRENRLSGNSFDLKLQNTRAIAGLLAAFEVIANDVPRWSLLSSLADRANLSTARILSCGVGHNYLAITPEGKIAKCHMELHEVITTVESPDPLAEVRTSQKGIRNLPLSDKTDCQECRWRYWCTGGCAYNAYRLTGRYDSRSPYCEIYQALFPEVIRLEGLRLLKYGVVH